MRTADKIPVGAKFYQYRNGYRDEFPQLVELTVTGGGEVYTELSWNAENGHTGIERMRTDVATEWPQSAAEARERKLTDLRSAIEGHQRKIEYSRSAVAYLETQP